MAKKRTGTKSRKRRVAKPSPSNDFDLAVEWTLVVAELCRVERPSFEQIELQWKLVGKLVGLVPSVQVMIEKREGSEDDARIVRHVGADLLGAWRVENHRRLAIGPPVPERLRDEVNRYAAALNAARLHGGAFAGVKPSENAIRVLRAWVRNGGVVGMWSNEPRTGPEICKVLKKAWGVSASAETVRDWRTEAKHMGLIQLLNRKFRITDAGKAAFLARSETGVV